MKAFLFWITLLALMRYAQADIDYYEGDSLWEDPMELAKVLTKEEHGESIPRPNNSTSKEYQGERLLQELQDYTYKPSFLKVPLNIMAFFLFLSFCIIVIVTYRYLCTKKPMADRCCSEETIPPPGVLYCESNSPLLSERIRSQQLCCPEQPGFGRQMMPPLYPPRFSEEPCACKLYPPQNDAHRPQPSGHLYANDVALYPLKESGDGIPMTQ